MTTPRDLPRWLATENAAKRMFELLGFSVEHISIEGRQIDLVAQKFETVSFGPETWIVEITTEKVDAGKGGTDYQKLKLGEKRYPGARMLLISTAGFTDDQKATLRDLKVLPLTFDEFEKSALDLRRYALAAIESVRSKRAPDIGYVAARYVEPELAIRLTDKAAIRVKRGDEWIDEILSAKSPGTSALLGNLGSGKTSLLQRATEIGCERFLADPSNCTIPIYVPLGRYKQHSGDIEQMLMSEFSRIGQKTYPAELVRYLIEQRRIILLLDGLDEVHPIQNTDDVLGTVTQILGAIGTTASAVITCRRQFLETTAEELAYFGAYTAGRLQDVQHGLARALRAHPATHIVEVKPFDRARIERYLAARCSMDSAATDRFFARFYGFADMAQTPVLLSMMATAIEENLLDPTSTQPFPLLMLYKSYTDRWIERDVGRARLNATQRRELSENLADHMLWTGRESETWGYIGGYLRTQDAWKNNPISDEEADLDVRNSGFVVRDLDNRYRFIHRSIMEYFAAVKELARLRAGDRPRHFPSDGFRLFLASLMAEDWISSAAPTFPRSAWDSKRGDVVLNAQMSMLAAASETLPSTHLVPLTSVGVSTSGHHNWRQVQFKDVVWRHSDPIMFVRCEFHRSTISLNAEHQPTFSDCEFYESTVVLDGVPTWEKSVYGLEGPLVAFPVPGFVWDLAALLDAGANVSVGNKKWTVTWDRLALCAEVFQRLRGKISKGTFAKGTYRDELARVLPVLVREGWVDEDTSRQGHQLTLTAKARTVVGKLKTDPFAVQEAFNVFE